MARCEVCAASYRTMLFREVWYDMIVVGADVEGTSRVAGGRARAEQIWGILIGRLRGIHEVPQKPRLSSAFSNSSS